MDTQPGTGRIWNPRNAIARWGAVTLVGVSAILLVACGGDASDEHTSSPPGMTGMGSSGSGAADRDFGEARAEEDGARAGGDDTGYSVAPSAASAPGGGTSATNLQGTLGRTIIRDGSVSLEVESVAQSFERVRQIAETSGGFVAESNFSGTGQHQAASLVIRIPAERFGDVVAELQGIAVEVRSSTSNSQDVTEEFTDLEASLRNLRAVEQQYLTLLGKAESIEDILLVQDRLSGVRYELERVQGRLNLLDNLASLATIRVSLQPTAAALAQADTGNGGFADRVSDAWASSLDAIESVATGFVVGLVWSWWLIPVVAVAAWLARRFVGRSVTRPRVDTPESAA